MATKPPSTYARRARQVGNLKALIAALQSGNVSAAYAALGLDGGK